MSLTLENAAGSPVAYTLFRFSGNRSTLVGPDSTDLITDEIQINSEGPARTAASFGNRRTSVNLLRSSTVPVPDETTVSKTVKLELVSSLPAGLSDSAVDEMIARMSSLLGNPTVLKQIIVTGQVQI